MTRRHPSLLWLIQHSTWTWVIILLYLSSSVQSLHSSTSKAEKSPRAALVTLTHDHDLPATLFSIQQLEDKFNNRYHYHWIFFSTRELSENFKRSTSNATNATCIYEVIPHENWSEPEWIDHHRLQESQAGELDYDLHAEKALPDVGQIYRWNSGLFAKEKRLRYYDWFWRVEPGAQFNHDVQFDVFRFMRDNGIAYGFNKAKLDERNLRALSPQIRSFMDKYPNLLHEEADVSWFLDTPSTEATSNPGEDSREYFGNDDEDYSIQIDTDDRLRKRIIREGSPSRVSRLPKADLQQDVGQDKVEAMDKEDVDTGSLADAFTSWLSGIYESSPSPTFEIGSLAFFRSPSHLAFFDHLDSAGEFYYKRAKSVPVHTLSASMFLPRQSVWNFRTRESRYPANWPSLPDPTPDPEFDLQDVGADSTSSVVPLGDPVEALTARLKQWELMAQDFGRQESIPGLLSGNTVIDERNFAALG
ncbi:hypothetical protein G7046_g9865 [Stylonectria norvegica]|nr:hypothetical protein G7046_g9865 [Stylonectria norvegica]